MGHRPATRRWVHSIAELAGPRARLAHRCDGALGAGRDTSKRALHRVVDPPDPLPGVSPAAVTMDRLQLPTPPQEYCAGDRPRGDPVIRSTPPSVRLCPPEVVPLVDLIRCRCSGVSLLPDVRQRHPRSSFPGPQFIHHLTRRTGPWVLSSHALPGVLCLRLVLSRFTWSPEPLSNWTWAPQQGAAGGFIRT